MYLNFRNLLVLFRILELQYNNF